mmetsp:Transcript_13585/g.57131  ORF Transcript_13585/g.57131 Transcript_13585/m.57131 type:complete len:504 (-) Transcript_13585:921-2432(-)
MGASRHSVFQVLFALPMRALSFPGRGRAFASVSPSRVSSASVSSSIQSRGECHRTKSARHDPGFAALNADMSETSWSLCRRTRTKRPSGVSPSACIAASRSRAVSSVNRGGGCVFGTLIKQCGLLSNRKPSGCVFLAPSATREGPPEVSLTSSSTARPSSSPPSEAVSNPSSSRSATNCESGGVFRDVSAAAGSAAPRSATKSMSSSTSRDFVLISCSFWGFVRRFSEIAETPSTDTVVDGVTKSTSSSQPPPTSSQPPETSRASRSLLSLAASERSYSSTDFCLRRRMHASISWIFWCTKHARTSTHSSRQAVSSGSSSSSHACFRWSSGARFSRAPKNRAIREASNPTPPVRGSATPLSQCAKRISRTNRRHSVATARALPKTSACSATRASRLSGGADRAGFGKSEFRGRRENIFSAAENEADDASPSNARSFARTLPCPPSPSAEKMSRSTSCTTDSGGARGGGNTPVAASSSQNSADARRPMVSASRAARVKTERESR